MQRERNYSIDAMRIISAFAVVVMHFNFGTSVGWVINAMLWYAVPFFLITSGYYIMGDELVNEKLRKSLKKNLKLFLKVSILLLAINIEYNILKGTNINYNAEAIYKFVIFNEWPFVLGGPMWYLQSVIYAEVFFIIIEKTQLKKYYNIIMSFFLVVNVCVGELSGILRLPCIKGNFFTRAIPYMLLGRCLRINAEKIKKIKDKYLLLLLVSSIIICYLEYVILKLCGELVYKGHFIGNGILAVILFELCMNHPTYMKNSIFNKFGKEYSLGIYLLHQPLGELLLSCTSIFNIKCLNIIKPVVIFVLSIWMIKCYENIKYKFQKYVMIRGMIFK